MLFSESITIDIIGVLVAFSAVFIAYFKWRYQYWKRKDFPFLEPTIPFGCFESNFKKTKTRGVAVKEMYEEVRRRGWKHCGIYTFANPAYFVADLDYLKTILTKDFHYFTDRGLYYNEDDDPMSAHLFAIGGIKWRNLRTKLTPTFTSGKMKTMFQTLVDCESSLQEVMERFYNKHEPIDIKEVLGCFTTDIIGSCAFGLDCNTFKEDDSPFRKYGKKFFSFTLLRGLMLSVVTNFEGIGKALGIRAIPKDITEFFSKVVKDTVEYREKNKVSRKDFLQLLIELKARGGNSEEHDGNSLTIDEIVAQCFVFFIAGFETSSTTMTFALYELAKNQDVQQKVRDEINTVLAEHDGTITYDSINEMKYMNQVIEETLRKYPPVPFITRQCVRDYKLPDGGVVIEKGTRVFIPIMGIHYDKEFFPDPEKFDPERFTEKNKRLRHPYAHIPFGEGPRICIGARFGMMQTKVGLTSLLKTYKFTVSSKTQEPLKMALNSFVLAATGDIWLNAEKI